uniref:Hairy/enhancer of split n=1 Tax=Strongylocentrotus purpuratus TaxID=7668 RepID=Q6JJ70_STRPU|nr:hairy/enhancer of split [Strongylocentrotus purpuratus]
MPLREVYFSKMPVDTKPKIHEGSGRKSSKPQMEKRRRARINDSLGQLKALILEATNKDSSRHSKLEKADILEMTVKHLRNIQRNQLTGPLSSDPNMVSRFRQGYSECVHEVARFFTNIENIGGPDMRLSLINHLANTCNPPTPSPSSASSQPSPPTSPVSVSPIAPLHAGQPTVIFPSPAATPSPTMSTAVNNTSQVTQPIRVQISQATSTALSSSNGIVTSPVQQQCVQSRVETVSPCNTNNVPAGHTQVLSGIPLGFPGSLPSGGEITLVLPPQALAAGGQLPSHFIPVYAQSAPILASPTMSPASLGPVSAESPKAYAQVHIPPPQIQVNAPQQVTAVQTPTLVALPAPAPAPIVRPTKVAFQTLPQPLTPPKTVLHTVHVQQSGEPVWRPWSHRRE